jgi:hypothetical protein
VSGRIGLAHDFSFCLEIDGHGSRVIGSIFRERAFVLGLDAESRSASPGLGLRGRIAKEGFSMCLRTTRGKLEASFVAYVIIAVALNMFSLVGLVPAWLARPLDLVLVTVGLVCAGVVLIRWWRSSRPVRTVVALDR